MIIRVFRAWARSDKVDAFARFFKEEALPLVRAQDGLVRVEVGLPMPPNADEFLMVTVWRDLDALRGFAGADWHTARLLPEERPLLRETVVHHYSVGSPTEVQGNSA
jgi:heme-degrading monooxygenase HmoA